MQELQGATSAVPFREWSTIKEDSYVKSQHAKPAPTFAKEDAFICSEELPSDSKEISCENEQELLDIRDTCPDSSTSQSPSPSSPQHGSLEHDSPVSNNDEADDDGSLDLTFDIPDGDGFWNHVREIPSTPSATDSEALPPATPLAADVEYVDGDDSAFDNEENIVIVGPNEDPKVGSLLPTPPNTTRAATNSYPLLPADDEDVPIADACSPPPQCRHHWSEWPAPAADAADEGHAADASSPPAASDAELIALLASCAGTSSCTAPACQRTHDQPGRSNAADDPWAFILGL